jgi:hypothetical protein
MLKNNLAVLTPILFSAGLVAAEQPKCPKGYQPYADRCISQRMSDYIACVGESGGNKESISLEISNAQGGKTVAGAKASGSGPVVKGSGSVILNHATEEAIATKFEEKWGKTAMEQCRKALDPPSAPKQKSQSSTEPADRANLHFVDEEFSANIQNLDFGAFILLKNVGKYRVVAWSVRTAIILSSRLYYNEEDQLFTKRPEWQIGGDVGTDPIYPGDTRRVHTHFGRGLSPYEYQDLLSGNKVFYVVSRASFRDYQGKLPETDSCRWWSVKDGKVSFGLCDTHNT